MRDVEILNHLRHLIRGGSVACEFQALERALGLDGSYAVFNGSTGSNSGPSVTWLLSSSVADSHELRLAAIERIRYALERKLDLRSASPTARKRLLVMRGRRKRAKLLLQQLEVESVLESVAR